MQNKGDAKCLPESTASLHKEEPLEGHCPTSSLFKKNVAQGCHDLSTSAEINP